MTKEAQMTKSEERGQEFPCFVRTLNLIRPSSLVMGTFLLVLACKAQAGPWPGWRGPDGNGISKEKDLALRWSTKQNVRWRTPLPQRCNSTPVIWDSRIFITQPIEKENRCIVMCFNRQDGNLLWQTSVTGAEKEATYPDNPPGSSSPVVDGKRVIAWFGSAGVCCY